MFLFLRNDILTDIQIFTQECSRCINSSFQAKVKFALRPKPELRLQKNPEIQPETKLRPKTEGQTGDRRFTGDRSQIRHIHL